MKTLVTGGKGMLATELKQLERAEQQIRFLDKEELDISYPEAIEAYLASHKPNLLINCAAYTNVEASEDEGAQLNDLVNATAVGNLAAACAAHNISFITISTDYVFAGTQVSGYHENDITGPLNAYGHAKLLGEQLAFQQNPQSIIIRTSRLYGGGKKFKNFVNTMLRLSETKTELSIIDDQRGNPTYAYDLAKKIQELSQELSKRQGKILHCSNTTPIGGITRYDFARAIFEQTKKEIICHPIPSTQYPSKAIRPKHSALVSTYPELSLPDRQDALQRYCSSVHCPH